jgi:hypothetical protein
MLEKFGEGKEFFNPISLANKRRPDRPMSMRNEWAGHAQPHLPVLLGRDLEGGRPDLWRVARWHFRRWWLRPWIA